MGLLPRDSSQGTMGYVARTAAAQNLWIEPGILVASVLPWPTADKT